MKKQIILALAFLSFMTPGSGPGQPAGSQTSTPPLIDEQGEQAVAGRNRFAGIDHDLAVCRFRPAGKLSSSAH